jgi:hypothetical protein
MSLMGEEVVDEWLNRMGFFTIRGIKLGVQEIDLLAFKPDPKGRHVCRHIEVQVSTNPIAYISKVPKAIQKATGVGPDCAKTRSTEEIRSGILEWIAKKFDHPKKVALRHKLFPGQWSRELVVNVVKHPEEVGLFEEAGVTVIQFKDVLKQMDRGSNVISTASGGDLLTLMQLGQQVKTGLKP